MIQYFPEPYPEEDIISLLARYMERSNYPIKQTYRNILGSGLGRNSLHLPKNLQQINTHLAPNIKFDVEKMIYQHTIYSFVTFGLHESDRNKFYQEMISTVNSSVGNWLKNLYLDRVWDTPLAYCPTCIVEDKLMFGEAYLHRIHSLGIPICPLHRCFLVRVLSHNAKNKNFLNLIELKRYIIKHRNRKRVQIKVSDKSWKKLVRICDDVLWILKNSSEDFSSENLYPKYVYHFKRMNFLNDVFLSQGSKFKIAFKEFLLPELLTLLANYGAIRNDETYLSDFTSHVYNHYNYKQCGFRYKVNSLDHILIIHFLGYSVKDFISSTFPNT